MKQKLEEEKCRKVPNFRHFLLLEINGRGRIMFSNKQRRKRWKVSIITKKNC